MNHRRLKSTDLQSVAIDRSATPPLIPYRVEDLVNSFYFLELIAFCSDCQPFFYLFLNLFVLSCWTAEIFLPIYLMIRGFYAKFYGCEKF